MFGKHKKKKPRTLVRGFLIPPLPRGSPLPNVVGAVGEIGSFSLPCQFGFKFHNGTNVVFATPIPVLVVVADVAEQIQLLLREFNFVCFLHIT